MAEETGTPEGGATTEAADSKKSAPSKSQGSQTSKSRTTVPQGSKTVVGLMGVTVLFSLIGHELKIAQHPEKATPPTGFTTGGKIIIGGGVATVFLVLLSHAGDGGRQLAVGLALVSMATATLVYGGPVWDSMNRAFGSKPTSPIGAGGPTTPTPAGTQPTPITNI